MDISPKNFLVELNDEDMRLKKLGNEFPIYLISNYDIYDKNIDKLDKYSYSTY